MNRPVPNVRGEERLFFAEAREHRLTFQQCADCGTRIAYPHVVCPHCLSDQLELRQASGSGIVHSFTTLHRAGHPGLADQVPYTVVLVDLDEGVRVLADLLELPSGTLPRIGMAVEAVFEDISEELSIPRFRATERAAS